MPCDYSAYPPGWPQLSKRIRLERAGGRCECRGECGAEHDGEVWPGRKSGRCVRMNGDECERGPGRVVLTVAHLCRPEDHDPPAKCGDEGHLLALCQACHLRLDHPIHVRHARETRAKRQGVQELPGFTTGEACPIPASEVGTAAGLLPVAGENPASPSPGPLPAISLWQPWATLIVIGAKRIETRDWPAPRKFWGKRIAIHAAKHWTREEHEIASEGYFVEALRTVPGPNVPRGCIVGTAILVRCVQIIGEPPERPKLGTQEYAFGGYAEGRWMWLMSDPIRFAEPIPCVGRQGFFDWAPPGPLVCRVPTEEEQERFAREEPEFVRRLPNRGTQHGDSREPVGAGKPARRETDPRPEHDALRSAVESPADATPRGEARDLPSPSPPTLTICPGTAPEVLPALAQLGRAIANGGEQGAAVGADGGQPDSGGPPAPLVALSDGWTCDFIAPCSECGKGVSSRDPEGRPRHRSCERAAGVAP